ncbi:phage tail protein [Escherichia coli]|nr:phage tail protein [Escherichia coli]
MPVPWPSATPPTGMLKCNGAAFSSEMYLIWQRPRAV